MKLSIVATLYCSAPYIQEFYERSSRTANQLAGDDYEIILVNDGSPDKSRELAIALSEADVHIALVDLSRNFGHHRAMMTGLAHAQGRLVYLIDSDLEEEPEWILPFDEQMKKEGCDVVYGIQRRRKGGFFEYWSGLWFYNFFNLITGIDLPKNITTARLMSHDYVEALLRHEEREIFIAGLWHLTGFSQSPQWVKKHHTSETTYSFRKKLALFVNAVTAFSNAPLKGIFYVGILILGFSIVYIAYIIQHWLFKSTPISGWSSLMASLWFLGGSIMSSIGIVGIYLSKIFSEVKRRPYTIVRKVYRK